MNEMYFSKGIASIAVCAAGAFCMWVTKGNAEPTGIGWTVLGLIFIWG